MADDETWKPVNGFDGVYSVSNYGRIKRNDSGKIISEYLNKTGYKSVCLCANGKKHSFLLHRIVALAFIPNPMMLPQVNHINENKQDNRAINLTWTTAKENSNYGTRKKRISEKNKISKCKPVLQIKDGVVINRFPSTISARHIADPAHISACCNGKVYKSAGGYQWRYV